MNNIYSHLSQEQLLQKRDQLLAALEGAASGVAQVSGDGRSVSYHQNLSELRRLLTAVQAELARRSGQASRRPIYLV